LFDFQGHGSTSNVLIEMSLTSADTVTQNRRPTTAIYARAGADHPRTPRPVGGGLTKVKGPPMVVKCNVGRYHGIIVAQRTVF